MSNTILPKKVTISDTVLFQQIGGECILLNMESEQYFGLDEIGARIWQELSKDGDTEKTVSQLLSEYNIDEAKLKEDLADLINELEKEKLIVIEG